MKLHSSSLSMIFIGLCLGLLLNSCTENEIYPSLLPPQEIKGRDYKGRRFLVYRVHVPLSWIRKDSLPDESLSDTTKAICEFFIVKEADTIRIAIHNFPSENKEQRIPPAAQVARWQRQFDFLIPSESVTIPQAFSGFAGVKFKGVGSLNKVDTMMLGWSLQMGDEHYRMLANPSSSHDMDLYREMRSDVTIKAIGPKSFMEEKEEEIIQFARSFELIKEIPTRS